MSVIIVSRSSDSMWIWSMSMSISTTDLMELDSIGSIFFGSIKSNMGEIVPDRERHSADNIGKEELVEHE